MIFGYVIVWDEPANAMDHGGMYCASQSSRDPWTRDPEEATVFASEQDARNRLGRHDVIHWDGRTKIVPLRAPTPNWAKKIRCSPPSEYEIKSLEKLRERRKTDPWAR